MRWCVHLPCVYSIVGPWAVGRAPYDELLYVISLRLQAMALGDWVGAAMMGCMTRFPIFMMHG